MSSDSKPVRVTGLWAVRSGRGWRAKISKTDLVNALDGVDGDSVVLLIWDNTRDKRHEGSPDLQLTFAEDRPQEQRGGGGGGGWKRQTPTESAFNDDDLPF